MARNNLIPLLVGCVALAAVFFVVSAETESFKFTVYQQMKDVNEVQVWKTMDGAFPGVVFDDKATKTEDPNSELYAKVGGLYYTISKQGDIEVIQDVSSIRFEDINEKGGRFSDGVVYLRTQWYADANGNDYPNQAGSIVGGSGGLSGAYGTVKFTQVKRNTFRIDGCFNIDH